MVVEDSRKALSQLAHNFYNNPAKSLKVIGITGTNGKTSITFILKSIFEEAGFKTGVIGTTGIFIGETQSPSSHTTPDPISIAKLLQEMLLQKVDIVFMEVSSHSLIQERVAGIDFTAALFTNLTHDHLDYHKTIENYALAKQILFNNLTTNAFAIVNADDKYSEKMVETTKAQILRIGRNPSNDLIISNEDYTPQKTIFSLNEKLFEGCIPGKFSIDNLAISIATAKKLGVSDDIISKSVRTTKGAPGRMEAYTLSNQAIAYIDYAHTPDALEKVLQTSKELLIKQGSGKLICVFGCGGDRDNSKRPVMGRIASEIADAIVITNDNPRTENPTEIIEQIKAGVINNKIDITIEADRAKAIKLACLNARENDIVLIAGKGHEDYQILGTKKIHFSDKEEVEKYI
jgi:UDP-N-acetylmuramoyl-L-alanyl-D-glutamate--2,6-diaminopimelate ligase